MTNSALRTSSSGSSVNYCPSLASTQIAKSTTFPTFNNHHQLSKPMGETDGGSEGAFRGNPYSCHQDTPSVSPRQPALFNSRTSVRTIQWSRTAGAELRITDLGHPSRLELLRVVRNETARPQ